MRSVKIKPNISMLENVTVDDLVSEFEDFCIDRIPQIFGDKDDLYAVASEIEMENANGEGSVKYNYYIYDSYASAADKLKELWDPEDKRSKVVLCILDSIAMEVHFICLKHFDEEIVRIPSKVNKKSVAQQFWNILNTVNASLYIECISSYEEDDKKLFNYIGEIPIAE